MKNVNATTWLGLILILSLSFEAATWLAVGFSGAAALRVIFLVVLFALLLKGIAFVRCLLGTLYAAGSALAVLAALRFVSQPVFAGFCFAFAVFSLAAGLFFFRSKVLKALTSGVGGQANEAGT